MMERVQFKTPEEIKRRSISYSDIKLRRYLRSERSKSKLKYNHISHSSVKKQENNEEKPLGLKRALLFSQQKSKNLTTRQTVEAQKCARKTKFYQSTEHIGVTKQLVKNIIESCKSHRKLLRFSDVRDRVKRQKEKSRSKERSLSKETNKHIQSIQPIRSSNKQQVKSFSRVGKFYPVDQINDTQLTNLKNPVSKNLFQKAQTDIQIQLNMNGNYQIKQNKYFSSDLSSVYPLQQSNFINENTVAIINQCQNKQFKSTDKILDLLQNTPCQLRSKSLTKNQLHRFKKIFPKGFFQT